MRGRRSVVVVLQLATARSLCPRHLSTFPNLPVYKNGMWVFGWPFDQEQAAKLARKWGFTSQETNDSDAKQRIIDRIYALRNRGPAEYIFADIDGEYLPIIALCRDEKARRKEDAKVFRKSIPPLKTCIRIQRLLGIPATVDPQWYWTDDLGDDLTDDDLPPTDSKSQALSLPQTTTIR